jgi:Lon protease-like protein
VIKAAAGDRKQLPIFPLNVVAMPHAVMPLMIFEARLVPLVVMQEHPQCAVWSTFPDHSTSAA